MKQNKAVAIGAAIAAVFGLTLFSQFIQSFFGQTPPDEQVAKVEMGTIKTDITDIVIGKGKEVISGSTVTLHYVGTLDNGRVFDSSRQNNTPFVFKAGQGTVIKGFDEGVLGMRVGGKREIVVPPEAGYGDKVVGPIPANSTLTFEIEVLGVE